MCNQLRKRGPDEAPGPRRLGEPARRWGATHTGVASGCRVRAERPEFCSRQRWHGPVDFCLRAGTRALGQGAQLRRRLAEREWIFPGGEHRRTTRGGSMPGPSGRAGHAREPGGSIYATKGNRMDLRPQTCIPLLRKREGATRPPRWERRRRRISPSPRLEEAAGLLRRRLARRRLAARLSGDGLALVPARIAWLAPSDAQARTGQCPGTNQALLAEALEHLAVPGGRAAGADRSCWGAL